MNSRKISPTTKAPSPFRKAVSKSRIRFVTLIILLATITTAGFAATSSAGPLGNVIFGNPSDSAAPAESVGARFRAAVASVLGQEATSAPAPANSTLNTARRGHTATALRDGKVLVVGGENESGEVGVSEVYDPATNAFVPGANLHFLRTYHAATLLPDGRVLATGGRAQSVRTNTTEIYDPATARFADGPTMKVARAGHVATVLGDGRILVSGGDADGSAEIYDPQANAFSLLDARMGAARQFHSAAVLRDGRVLIVGGKVGGEAVKSAEVFNPQTPGFSSLSSELRVARSLPFLRVLHDGKVQVMGGSAEETMEVFDPNGEFFGAYGHIIPTADEHELLLEADVLSAPTRAAIIFNGHFIPSLDRSSHTNTELSQPSWALVAGGKNSAGATLNAVSVYKTSHATVSTDKLDYAPGQTAVISGTGWQAGETVSIVMHEDPHTHTERRLSAVADSSGKFTANYLVEDHDLSVTFVVGTKGALSGRTAQTTFTDGNIKVRGSFLGGTNPASDNFNLTYIRYTGSTSGATCSGTPRSQDTPTAPTQIVTTSDFTVPPAGHNSSLLTAAPTSAGGRAFVNWTDSSQPGNPVVTTSQTWCFEFPPGTDKTYVANYGSANIAPVAVDDVATTDEDVALTLTQADLKGNDTDVDNTNAQLSVTAVANATNGTVVLNGVGGNVTFTPAANFSGTAGFDYTLSDGSLTDTGHVTVTVKAVNDAPVAANESYSTNEDTPLTVPAPGVLGNDTDVEGASLSAAQVSSPASGTLTLNSNGSFTYTPNANFSGTDSFTYKAKDPSNAESNSATVTITINAVNDAPVANGDSYSVNEDTQLNVATPGVLANDTDADNANNALSAGTTAVLVTGPTAAQGNLTLNANGSFSFAPASNFNGTATFTYNANDGGADSNVATVTITVNAVNDAPAANGDSYGVNEGATLNQAAPGVLGNDTDAENSALTATMLTGPAHAASFTLNANGSFTYTHDGSETLTDSFTYKANDGGADSGVATVTFTINPVNDPPVAVNDGATTNEDTFVDIDVIANDTDVDSANSALSVATGSITAVTGGTAIPQPDGRTVRFTPAPNANSGNTPGGFSFKYKAKDTGNAQSNEATVTISVASVNDAPVAVNDAANTNEDTFVDVNVVANDTDADNANGDLKVASGSIVAVTGGTAILQPDGRTVRFTPAADANGDNTPGGFGFTYRVTDGSLTSTNEATVSITVAAVNDRPVVDLNGPDKQEQPATQGIDYAAAFTEDGGALSIVYVDGADASKSMFVSDVDSANLGSATATITNLQDGNAEVLAVDTTPRDPQTNTDIQTNITATYNPVTGVLTLTGADTLEHYQAVLRTVTYNNTSQNPGTAARTIHFVVNDGTANNDPVAVSTVSVAAVNDVPTVNAGAVASIDEGSNFQRAGSFTDPDSTTWSATVDYGDGSGAQSLTLNAGKTFNLGHTYADNGSYTVTVSVSDGDPATADNTGTGTFVVTVNNVAPTLTAAANQAADESVAKSFDLGSFTDPGTIDSPWKVDVNWGDGASEQFDAAAAGALSQRSHAFVESGSYTVKVKVTDKDGAPSAERSFTVAVANVAPTATFNAPSPVNEGSPISLSLTDPHDTPGDTAAGFSYAFDCGSGYGAYGTNNTATCPTTDNGTRTVKGKIKDRDGGEREYTASVTIDNVAPTAVLGNNGPVNEGSPATISFGNQSDPSSADTAAGFHYAFDCGNGSLGGATYANSGAVASTPCTFNNDGSYTVKGRILDKDGGFTEYTTLVTVVNVPPTVDVGTATAVIDEGGTFSRNGSFTDPGADTWSATVDYGDGSGVQPLTLTGKTFSLSHAYADSGNYTVTVKVNDGTDTGTDTVSLTVNNVAPTAALGNNGPVNEGSPATITFTSQFDPSSADTAAGFRYAYACDSSSLSSATYAASGTSATATCTFDDGPSTRTVRARIIDKDGGFTEYTTDVTVKNVTPTAAINGAPASSPEGTQISLTSTVSDPSTTDTQAGFTYAWSVTKNNNPYASGTDANLSFTPDDNGTYVVALQVKDKDNGTGTAESKTITVTNVAPSPAINGAPATSPEGTQISLTSSVNDPGPADTHTHAWSVTRDGSPYASGTNPGFSFTPNDNGTYVVSLTVKDDDDGSGSDSKTVSVTNVAPTAVFNAPSPVNEGSSISLSLTGASDPSSVDTTAGLSYAFDCGAGAGYSAYGTGSSVQCPTIDNGTRTVKGKIRDKDNGEREYTAGVTINNVAPTAVFNAPSPVNEGSSISLSLTSPFDPSSADSAAGFSYAFDCGAGAGYGPFGGANTATCPTTDNGPRTVKGMIRDKDNGVSEYIQSVTINNVVPLLNITAPTTGQLYQIGTPTNLSASFTDAGTGDTHTCQVKWDDETTTSSAGTVAETNGSGTCTASRTYTKAGVYTIEVTLKDDDGATDVETVMIVVYDPNGGFVTGGGWITSPINAYVADPSLTGRANFGFVSKYQKGAQVPTGETEFQFKLANLNFHSTVYEWLVVAGARAQYKGSGKINGAGNYGFLLTATDGQVSGGGGVDKFRIKIWDKDNNGAIVYDNVLAAADDIDAASPQAISGGSIVVHSK